MEKTFWTGTRIESSVVTGRIQNRASCRSPTFFVYEYFPIRVKADMMEPTSRL